MRHTVLLSLVLALLLTGCPKGKYDDLADAPESDRVAAEQLWADYMKALGNRNASKDPVLVAGFFYLVAINYEAMGKNQLENFDDFMLIMREAVGPMISSAAHVPLLVVSLGATAMVGAVSEVIHYLLVRMRSKKTKPGESKT